MRCEGREESRESSRRKVKAKHVAGPLDSITVIRLFRGKVNVPHTEGADFRSAFSSLSSNPRGRRHKHRAAVYVHPYITLKS